jgi:NADPH:quinone reductase-like Zn-dependent oxidoreductase
MKAVTLAAPGGLEKLHLKDLPDPGAPGPGAIRVRLHASSLNYHDYAVVRGVIPAADGRIPMADGAGVVEAIGEGVSDFAVGDAVLSCFFPLWQDGPASVADFKNTPGDGLDGYGCEVAVRPASWFTHAPRGWSHAEAATITTAGLTAWRALVADGGLKAGDSVLVLGTGGVSIFALQLAKAMGATVIATSSSDAKLERVGALGADHTINYRTTPQWGEAVHALTGGRGVDHVVEVGGPGTLPQSIAAVRIGGHIHLIGVLTGRSGEVPTALLMAKQARLQGLIVGSRRHQRDMVRALEATGIRPVVDRSFPLEAIAEAFRYEESGAHLGKIVLECIPGLSRR